MPPDIGCGTVGATKNKLPKDSLERILEEIKHHHEKLDAGLPEEKPPCPYWTEDEDCRGQVIWKGLAVRTGLKVGTEDYLPEVRLRQCLCHVHRVFRVYIPLVLPHKHYVASRVDAALESAAEGTPRSVLCRETGIHDARTPGRWISQWRNRLEATADIVGRCLKRLEFHRLAPVVHSVEPPANWTCRSAWKYLSEVLAEWPEGTLAPPLSYLALKA